MLIYILLMFGVFFTLERIFPAMAFADIPNWYGRAFFVNFLSLGVQLLAGFTWDNWLNGSSLVRLQDYMAAPIAAFIAYIIKTFFAYWWHRLIHYNPFLWRTIHQLHHSPTRIETLTAYYLHPFDFMVYSVMGAVIMFGGFGFDANAAGWYILFHGFAGFFFHSNVAGIPRWVGYFIQTPTMHRIHHEYDVHNYNFGDIVWWDMIFGTYRNDRVRVDRCGFDEGLEQRVVEMLFAKDVNKNTDIFKPRHETSHK